MKFQLTFKTPDVLDELGLKEPRRNATEAQWDEYEKKKAEMMPVIEKFVSYGEYITVEFDSQDMSAKVV